MSKKQVLALIKNGKMPKVTDYRFKDFKTILEAYGYEQERFTNSVHVKFINPETKHFVIVSSLGSKQVQFPIVQKILKEVHNYALCQ